MAKKSSQTVNRCMSIFLMLLFITSFIACQDNPNKEEKGREADLSDSINKKEAIIFIPDTAINGKLFLENEESINNFYSAPDNLKLIDSVRESPVFAFLNKSKTEYLLLYQYEGSSPNRFDCFEIGYVKSSVGFKGVVLEQASFMTNSGIHLGMPIDSLIKLKGKAFANKNDTMLQYEIFDYKTNAFLNRYNMPLYFFKCSLERQKINNIKFGFLQP